MEGYYIEKDKGKGRRVPTGCLRISVKNLNEFNDLIYKAKKDADQLIKTIDQLESFKLEIDFDEGEPMADVETVSPR